VNIHLGGKSDPDCGPATQPFVVGLEI
jgi:hypothetical protein